MKVTMIIGEPCVGKSVVMGRFMNRVGNWIFRQPKWVPYHAHVKNGRVIGVLGRYDDMTHQFPGTDRMSMAAQPKALNFIDNARVVGWDSILFEGDRLGNLKMAKALQAMDIDFVVVNLFAAQSVLRERRRKERSQSETFLKSRNTKVMNMLHELRRAKVTVHGFELNTLEDTDTVVDYLVRARV